MRTSIKTTSGALARSLNRFPPGRRLADDLDVGVGGEEFDEPGAHQVVVVGDQHAVMRGTS